MPPFSPAEIGGPSPRACGSTGHGPGDSGGRHASRGAPHRLQRPQRSDRGGGTARRPAADSERLHHPKVFVPVPRRGPTPPPRDRTTRRRAPPCRSTPRTSTSPQHSTTAAPNSRRLSRGSSSGTSTTNSLPARRLRSTSAVTALQGEPASSARPTHSSSTSRDQGAAADSLSTKIRRVICGHAMPGPAPRAARAPEGLSRLSTPRHLRCGSG